MRILVLGLSLSILSVPPLIAQQVEHRAEVNARGFFVVESASPGAPTVGQPGSAIATSPNPNPSAGGLRWTYPNPVGMPWITQSTSVGNDGTFAWLGQNLNFERVTMAQTTDHQVPALPVYESMFMVAPFADVFVAAADRAEGCAVLWIDPVNALREIRYHSGFQALPLASRTDRPGQEIEITADGSVVAVGYTDVNSLAAVDLYDSSLALLGTLTGTIQTFREHEISGDGSTVLIASQTDNFVFDVGTSTMTFQDSTTVSHDAHAIDFDGDTWARGGFDVGAWKKGVTTYTRVLTYNDPNLGFPVYTACGLSADGSTFAVSAYDATDSNQFRVYCFALTPTSSSLLWTFAHTSTGGLQNVPQAVEVSDDGRIIAVAAWGGQSNGQPEVLVFDRDLGNVPIQSIDTPGSAFTCDVSGDGQFIVAGTKAVHANTSGNGGEGYSLDVGGQGLSIRGTSSIGRDVALDLGGTPGEQVLIMASLNDLATPVAVPGLRGTFGLDPTLFILLPFPVGSIPGSGKLTLSAIVPNDPLIVGVNVFVQTARISGPSGFLDNVLKVPLTP